MFFLFITSIRSPGNTIFALYFCEPMMLDNFYLNKYGFQAPSIQSSPASNLGLVIVIPCFNEPDIIPTLNALHECTPTQQSVEVIIVINSGEQHPASIIEQNAHTTQSIEAWTNQVNTHFQLHVIQAAQLPKKHAGVGLARKIGMDEAVARFHQINRDGIIVCFDADSTCAPNYMTAIEAHFNRFPDTPGCAIRFAHPLEGPDFDTEIYDGIINYELFLRYYNQGLVYAGLPFAYHTVGSSMAVRSSVYQKQGGMNKRKAGEDFYFLHKIISLGQFTTLDDTVVYPSPRTSDRVPFGTGKAINDWIENESSTYLTYAIEVWEQLREFAAIIPSLQQTDFNDTDFAKNENHYAFKAFLEDQNITENLINIRQNSSDLTAFTKRFFVWFNAFKVLKLVHYLRDHQFENRPIYHEAKALAKTLGFDNGSTDLKAVLEMYRDHENLNI